MVNRQHGLGRGLGALLSSPGPSSTESGTTTVELPIDSISPNPQQPRKDFDDNSLHDLAASLKQSGVLQPVVVRRLGDGYQLVVGERRWRAAKLAGMTRIPALIREASDAQSLELALVENLLREDLNPMEEAEAYQRLLAEFSWTQEELAQRVARDRSTIANCLRLLKLPDVIQADLRGGRLTMGHARALLSLDSPTEQLRLREIEDWLFEETQEEIVAEEAFAVLFQLEIFEDVPGVGAGCSVARRSWPRSKTRCAWRSPPGSASSATSAPGASRSATPPARNWIG